MDDDVLIDLGLTVVSWADPATATSVRHPHRQRILAVGRRGLYLIDRPVKQRIIVPAAVALGLAGAAAVVVGGPTGYAAGGLGVVAALLMFYLAVQRTPLTSAAQLRALEARGRLTYVPFDAIDKVGALTGASRILRWSEIHIGDRILRLHHGPEDYHRLRQAVGSEHALLFRSLPTDA